MPLNRIKLTSREEVVRYLVASPAMDRLGWMLDGLQGTAGWGGDAADVLAPEFAARMPPDTFAERVRQRPPWPTSRAELLPGCGDTGDMRVRAFAGVAGPVVFTAAWIAASLRQTGHGAFSVQLSGLAAADARDPWIMTTGFLVLGGCTAGFGQELAGEVAGLAPRLIQGAGVLTVAAGLLHRDHMELTSGPLSWHNQAHNVVSLAIYVDLVLAQVLLARRFGAAPGWRGWRPWVLAGAAATAATLAVFIPNTASPAAGVLQRVAVSIPLVTVAAVAARLSARPPRGAHRGSSAHTTLPEPAG